jgi:glycosyltransferase involved in cell wall biosynthesis
VTSIGRFVKCPKLIYLQEPYRPLYEALPILPWAALPSSGRWYSPKYVKKYIGDFIRVQALRVQVREEVLNARTFDTILVNSFFSRESILRAYGLDARVCYLGVDTDMFVDKNQLRENFVVGVGSFDGSKNIEFIIKALSLLPEPRPALVWVGDRGNASIINPLRQLANSMDVSFEPRVRISDVELVAILNRARLMAYAPRLEPFGYAPLEANACGLPVVAVAEGGVRETVIDGVNGLLVEHSHQAMADAIRRLLDDKEYAQMLGKSGRRLVEQKWQVAASVDRLEQRILEVLENVSNH